MSLLPEQLQALSYARRAGSEAPIASIRQRLEGTFGQLERLVAAVPEDVARRRAHALSHVAQIERTLAAVDARG